MSSSMSIKLHAYYVRSISYGSTDSNNKKESGDFSIKLNKMSRVPPTTVTAHLWANVFIFIKEDEHVDVFWCQSSA